MGVQVYKAVCQNCGKEFESFVNPKNANRRKFCSKSCSATVQHNKFREKHGSEKGKKRPNYTGICAYCGKEFTRFVPLSSQKKNKGLCCSNSCKSLLQWEPRKLTDADKTKTCEYCGKDFVYGKNNKGQRFCSLKCANAKKIEEANLNDRSLVCKHCGKEFVRNLTDKELANGKGKYCSRECHNKHIAWEQLYCEQCGKPLKRGYGDKYCSKKCAGLSKRHENGYLVPSGYIMMTVEDGRRVPQHRYVMEQMVGRVLFPEETVHHKNGIRDDNDPSNLELWTNAHPYGQRVKDLISFVVKQYRAEVLEQLKHQLNHQPTG
jgi:endogenous inhibitor of DNA gyrase (YacG/DUF329 family)